MNDARCKSGDKDKGLASFGATNNYPARFVRGAKIRSSKDARMLLLHLLLQIHNA
jgi:hypothetical protein